MNKNTQISVIDIEASGLGRGSYPIEIGLAMDDGSARCMIIRPHQDWQHWDESAEQLHGIARHVLVKYGTDIPEAASLLNRWLRGMTIYSDAWGNDNSWLAMLFEYAELVPQFKIESLRSLLDESQVPAWHQTKEQVAKDFAFNRHRASNDARILQHTFYRILAAAGQVSEFS
jgi:hypothetical protein